MKVLVDTCIWSLALRRKNPVHTKVIDQLRELIADARVEMLGPIRQEILSGIAVKEHFTKLRQYLLAFDDHPLSTKDYEMAAELYNLCRAKGIQGSNTDFLICSAAINHEMLIFTSDKDFASFSKVLPIKLFNLESRLN